MFTINTAYKNDITQEKTTTTMIFTINTAYKNDVTQKKTTTTTIDIHNKHNQLQC